MLPCILVYRLSHAHLYFERGVHLLPLPPLPIPHPGFIPHFVDILCTIVVNILV